MGNSVGGGNSAGFDIVGVTENREMYVYKSTVESGVANAAFRAILLAAQSHAVPAEGKAPVSAVYPFSPVKANVGRLCEELKNALKSGLEQRCNSNFLAIFVEVILWFLTG